MRVRVHVCECARVCVCTALSRTILASFFSLCVSHSTLGITLDVMLRMSHDVQTMSVRVKPNFMLGMSRDVRTYRCALLSDRAGMMFSLST